jgi:hypothetical protein
MSKLDEYEGGLKVAQARLGAVTLEQTRLETEAADLQEEIRAFTSLIQLEKKRTQPLFDEEWKTKVGAILDAVTVTRDGQQGDDKAGEEEGPNKTRFVLDLILKNAHYGTTTDDLKRAAKEANLAHPPTWPYTPLSRLKSTNKIVKRRGKFYPAPPKEQALALVS